MKTKLILMMAVLIAAGGSMLLAWKMMPREDVLNHLARLPKVYWGEAKASTEQDTYSGTAVYDYPHSELTVSATYTDQNNITALATDGESLWIGSTGGLRRIPADVAIPEGPGRLSDMELVDRRLVNELPSALVRDLAWAGDHLVVLTEAGPALVKNNNSEISVVSMPMPDGVPDTAVTAMAIEREGLIIGTERKGLFMISGSTVQSLPGAEELAGSRVTSLEVFEGAIFAGTLGQGIFKIADGVVERLTNKHGLPDEWITDLLVRDDKLWIATTSGLVMYENGSMEKVSGTGFHITGLGICGPDESSLCAGTMAAGVINVSATRKLQGLRPDLPPVQAVLDTNGRLWVGTEDGLWVGTESGWREIRAEGPASNDITSMAVLDDKLWVGTFDRGLSSFDGRTWTHYSEIDGLASDMINHITSDGKELWIGHMKGASRFDGRNFYHFDENDGLGSDHVMAVAVWNNRIAFATSHGVSVLDEQGRITSYGTDDGLAGKNVYTLAVSGPYLWAGTLTGLSRFDGLTWTSYTFQNRDLPDNWVTALADVQGELWVGTYDKGLAVLAGDTRRFYLEGRDIPHGWINPNAMLSDGDTLWMGLMSAGLLYHDEQGFGYMTRTEGLIGDDVTALAGYAGKLHVSTRSGISVIDENSTEDVN